MKFQEKIFVLQEKTEMEKPVHQEVQNISSSPSIGKITGLKRE
jgi:hypothetical protein